MIIKVVLLILVITSITMSAPVLSIEEEWVNFKTKHSKTYESSEEDARRFEVFQDNLKKIQEHNEKYDNGEVTFKQGINQFADLTPEEFKAKHLHLKTTTNKPLIGLAKPEAE